jgi:hypothetical protein
MFPFRNHCVRNYYTSPVKLRSQLFANEQVLPSIIGNFQNAGYQLVTMAECLSVQLDQTVGSPAARDVSKYRSFIIVFSGLMSLQRLVCALKGQTTSGIGCRWTRTVVHCIVNAFQ